MKVTARPEFVCSIWPGTGVTTADAGQRLRSMS